MESRRIAGLLIPIFGICSRRNASMTPALRGSGSALVLSPTTRWLPIMSQHCSGAARPSTRPRLGRDIWDRGALITANRITSLMAGFYWVFSGAGWVWGPRRVPPAGGPRAAGGGAAGGGSPARGLVGGGKESFGPP